MKKVFLALCTTLLLVNCLEDDSESQNNPLIGAWNLESWSAVFSPSGPVAYDTSVSLIPLVITKDSVYYYDSKQKLEYSTSYKFKEETATTGSLDYGKDGKDDYTYKFQNGKLVLSAICEGDVQDCGSVQTYVPCNFNYKTDLK